MSVNMKGEVQDAEVVKTEPAAKTDKEAAVTNTLNILVTAVFDIRERGPAEAVVSFNAKGLTKDVEYNVLQSAAIQGLNEAMSKGNKFIITLSNGDINLISIDKVISVRIKNVELGE